MTAEAQPPAPVPLARWGAPGWALVLAAFAVGFANFPLQAVGTDLSHMPGDVVDNRLNLCVLEHGYRYLVGRAPSFWDIEIYYPARGVTAWSDAHIGMLPLYAAMRAVGLSPERAFQGWYLIPFVLNFAAAAWAARQFGLRPVGSAVAGYVFAYALPLAGQMGHAQLFPRFLVPPAIVFAWGWARSPRDTWRLAACAACVVYQTYISVYIGYFLGLTLATGGLITLLVTRGRLPWADLVWVNWRVWLARVLVGALAAGALYPLVSAHRRGGSEVKKEHVKLFAPRPKAWITPPGMAAAFPELGQYTKLGSTMPGAGEEQVLPGLLVLAAVAIGLPVALYALVRPASFGPITALAVAAWTCFLLAFLVTKYNEPDWRWYYEPLLELPGAAGIRAPSRVVLVLLFPGGFALGAILDGLTRLAGRWSPYAGAVVAVLALGAVAIDQRLTSTDGARKNDWWWARNSRQGAVDRYQRVASAVRQHPNPRLVYVFPSTADWLGPGGWPAVQLDTMRACQDLDLPTVNGWSGRSPPDWAFFPDWTPPASYRALMTWLTEKNAPPPEMLEGLVLLGEPKPDADPSYDAPMRAKYPPRAIPARPE